MKCIIAMLGLIFLAGCSSDPVHLRHVSTGAVAQCGPYPKTLGMDRLVVNERERGCIYDYQRQGYERVMN